MALVEVQQVQVQAQVQVLLQVQEHEREQEVYLLLPRALIVPPLQEQQSLKNLNEWLLLLLCAYARCLAFAIHPLPCQ